MVDKPTCKLALMLTLILALLALSFPLAASAQMPPIGSIDFYGLRSLSERSVREAIAIQSGDSPPASAERAAIEGRLTTLPGVIAAELSVVCCEEGRTTVYVGIAEDSSALLEFHEPPTSAIRLPESIVASGRDFEIALVDAVRAGRAGDDLSQGHSLIADSATRAVQQHFIAFAERDLPLLREVLRTSANAEHRALAAQVIGYAHAKHAVIDDLLHAVRDADDGVRNNATRALMAIAHLGSLRPELEIRVPADPFIAMLHSLRWSDRNKSAGALLMLTGDRDALLIRQLRERALDPLVEMARWTGMHAGFAFLILGRVADLPEERLLAAMVSREARESVVVEALRALERPR